MPFRRDVHSFRKIGSDWCVQLAEGSEQLPPGTEVTVTKANGETKQVTLGEYVGTQFDQHLFKVAPTARPAQATVTASVGDLGGVIALFDRARPHLRYPAIVLTAGTDTIKINVAGANARVPGSLNVLSTTRESDTQYGLRPFWYGRVHRDGRFEPSQNTDSAMTEAITARLRALAANPATVAAEHGRLTGHCCFCRKRLTDERSTMVGYGPDCAGHYGLPWGDRPADFASATPRVRRSPRRHLRRTNTGLTQVGGGQPPSVFAGFQQVAQRLPLETPAPAAPAAPATTPTEPQRYDDIGAATRLEDSER